MNLQNPFNRVKREASQEELMTKQLDKQTEDTILSNATHPQDMDVEAFQQRENMMAELTKWQQDLDGMLKELFMNLAGLSENENGKLTRVTSYKPLCNIKGAKRFIDTLKPIDKNVMNGAWTIKQINDVMIALDDTNVQDILEHWQEYDIEYSVAEMDRICETILISVYPTFLRGLENGERKYHGQIQKLIETRNITPERKKPGLFSKE